MSVGRARVIFWNDDLNFIPPRQGDERRASDGGPNDRRKSAASRAFPNLRPAPSRTSLRA
jgi:hypothetical protein